MSTSTKVNVLIVLSAFAIILLSVFVTLYFSGRLSMFGSVAEEGGYKNVTFTDSSLSCEKETKKEFGKRLVHMVVDGHSSRYEARDYAYRIYLEVDAKNKDNMKTSYYVNCYVNAGNGRINVFEVLEQGEAPKSEAIRKNNSNPFGFPGGA